jgi:hypothetical protein
MTETERRASGTAILADDEELWFRAIAVIVNQLATLCFTVRTFITVIVLMAVTPTVVL